MCGISRNVNVRVAIIATILAGTLLTVAPTTAFASVGDPGPPLYPAAASGDGIAILTWRVPATSGDSVLDHYLTEAYNCDGSQNLSVPNSILRATTFVSQLTVNNLHDGQCIFFDIFAYNTNGHYSYASTGQAFPFAIQRPVYTYDSSFPYTPNIPAYGVSNGRTTYSFPNSTIGKLYFTDPDTGGVDWCSAAVVVSPSQNLLITARHCLNNGGNNGVPGTWHQHYEFYPSWVGNNYATPTWFIDAGGALTSSWLYDSNIHDDFGVLAVDPYGPPGVYQPVQSYTGALGIGFDRSALDQAYWRISGYSNDLDGGYQQHECTGILGATENFGPYNPSTDGSERVQGCNMGHGASGSPWRDSNDPGIEWGVVSYIAIEQSSMSLAMPSLYIEAQSAWHYAVAAFS